MHQHVAQWAVVPVLHLSTHSRRIQTLADQGQDAKGGDLPPRPECAAHWRARLFEHLPQIDLFLLVGQYAQSWHLGAAKRKSLTETVMNWREYGPGAIPLPHPSWRNNAWIRKNPWFERELLPVLKREVRARL